MRVVAGLTGILLMPGMVASLPQNWAEQPDPPDLQNSKRPPNVIDNVKNWATEFGIPLALGVAGYLGCNKICDLFTDGPMEADEDNLMLPRGRPDAHKSKLIPGITEGNGPPGAGDWQYWLEVVTYGYLSPNKRDPDSIRLENCIRQKFNDNPDGEFEHAVGDSPRFWARYYYHACHAELRIGPDSKWPATHEGIRELWRDKSSEDSGRNKFMFTQSIGRYFDWKEQSPPGMRGKLAPRPLRLGR